MKVLLVGYLHSEGGVKHHVLWLARGLAERGHQVTVATPSPLGTEEWNLPVEPGLHIVNIDHIGQVLRNYPGVGDTTFDCAIVTGTGWKSMLGPLLNRRVAKRIYFEGTSGDRAQFLDPRMLIHWGYDAIVAQGRPIEDNVCRNFHWKGRRTTIPALPHPLERVADLTRPPRAAPTRGALRAGYFSRLVPHKGACWLVEQWDVLSRHIGSLELWGTGPDEERIRTTIAAKGLGDRITLHGAYRGDAAYVARLQSLDVELLPTVGWEGAPLVLLEAMACGLPFVANGMGGIPDYANPDCRITSGDIDEFLPALDSLAEALYAGAIDHDRLQRHYLEHFSFRALIARWETFLSNVVGK